LAFINGDYSHLFSSLPHDLPACYEISGGTPFLEIADPLARSRLTNRIPIGEVDRFQQYPTPPLKRGEFLVGPVTPRHSNILSNTGKEPRDFAAQTFLRKRGPPLIVFFPSKHFG